jgi:predicted helicase
MNEVAIRKYLRSIEQAYRTGNATEHTYRSYLKELLETLYPDVTATNEPKRVKYGAPDFIIACKQTPLGHIETKDIGVSLDQIERTDQMKRYLGGFSNLILTDYIEFRWYVAGQHRMTARLAKVGGKGKWTAEADGIEQVGKLLQGFMLAEIPTIATPKELAIRMASIAQLIRDAINQAFQSEEGGGTLHLEMEGFRQVLLPDLTREQFADMYAQTICYGLFAARCNSKPNTLFTREYAAFHMPKTNPFLSKLFGYMAGPDLDERVVWAVDDLAEVLNRCDMAAILRDFGKRTRQEDPVVHFYETFLSAYDPKMREMRGVYYTPEPVVSYIVRSVDYLLKKDFGLAEGLADATKLKVTSADGKHGLEAHKVQILDPATGTGTFLHSVIDLIYESFQNNKGMWSSYVSEHLLPRLFGFELLMAPYTVAHMKLGLQLTEMGYDFKGKSRLGVYLTNTLGEVFEGPTLPFVQWLVEEADAAGNVKNNAPVMVIIGNPPYSGHSANSSWKETREGRKELTFIGKLLQDYYKVDGVPLGERNPKWLQDDYVKFIRFAQWRIERTGYGILAFITNHGYLDNPTFRGMRQSLMQTFDDIYVLDLHGNAMKKEQAPDGSKDENVFDIQQGVAIGLFVKRQNKAGLSQLATVHHAHLYGPREVYQKVAQEQYLVGGKYRWLTEHDITITEWRKLEPETPFYLFVPQDIDLRTEYEQGWKLTDIFPVNNIGMQTHRDYFITDIDVGGLYDRIAAFRGTALSDDDVRERFDLGSWDFAKARTKLRANSNWQADFVHCLWRPFDTRFLYYSKDMIDRPRPQITEPLLQENRALLAMRQIALQEGCSHFLVANMPPIDRVFYSNKGAASVFPLYLYPDSNKNTLFNTAEPSTAPGGRRPNLSPAFITAMEDKLGMRFVADGRGDLQETFGPEDVFDYMYAVFHSPTYRSRYAEFLKIDFPRLPLTANADLFRELCKIGRRLVALHLMEQFGKAVPSYPVDGGHLVEKVEYLVEPDKPEQGRVYINKAEYFEGVPPEVWEFHVGGYQVCQKWLKDRKGRALSFDDIKHYQRIVAALAETIVLMDQVDKVIDEYGGWPIE